MCRFEDADDGLGDEDPVYANCVDDEPLYENFSLSHYSNFHFHEDEEYSDDEEHIYEHVHHGQQGHHPVNVFLALLQGSATISPDPNIYEVPPGAIRRDSALFDDSSCGRNITPPSGFQVSDVPDQSYILYLYPRYSCVCLFPGGMVQNGTALLLGGLWLPDGNAQSFPVARLIALLDRFLRRHGGKVGLLPPNWGAFRVRIGNEAG
jgi:hypothetical protein